MTTSYTAIPNVGIDHYGYGWILSGSTLAAYSHSGGFDGFRTSMNINPDLELEIIVLANDGDRTDHLRIGLIELVERFYN